MEDTNKLETFLSKYTYPPETTLADKYKSIVMDYYRRNLQTTVYHLGEGNVHFKYGKAHEVVKEPFNVIPEFEYYVVKTEQENKIFGFFKKIGNEIKEVGDKAGTGLKAAGTFIWRND